MGLREHNAMRLRWWLDADYPNRIQGRIPPETVLESRKLEGSVLLKKEAYERVEDYRRARASNATDWEKRRGQTDELLLYLTDGWLRSQAENSSPQNRVRCHLMHSAMRQVCLSENTAGGWVELERLERLGKNNHTIRVVVGFARAAVEAILDELEQLNFRLEVAEDKRAKDKYDAMCQDRPAVIKKPDSYRLLAAQRRELVCEGLGSSEATAQVAQANGVSERKVYEAVKFVREAELSAQRQK